MSAKLVFTVQSVSLCENITHTLRWLGITDESIGVIASDKTPLPALPDACSMKCELTPAVQHGEATGAVTGAIAGLVMTLAAPGFVIGGADLALAAIGRASFSTLASGLIGTSVPNSHLNEYQDAISNGALLLVVQVPDEQVRNIRDIVSQWFPSLTLEDELTTIA